MSVGGTTCRACGAPLELTVVDLGKSPLCESFLPADRIEEMEPFYPLHVRACTRCWLAQLPSFVPPDEIFTEYAYFSAYSDSWVAHARDYVEMISDAPRADAEQLSSSSSPRTTATSFSTSCRKGIPVLGIDPAANVAEAAEERGVPTVVEFFGVVARPAARRRGQDAPIS